MSIKLHDFCESCKQMVLEKTGQPLMSIGGKRIRIGQVDWFGYYSGIWKLLDRGMKPREVAKIAGITEQAVRYVRRLRSFGKRVRFTKKSHRKKIQEMIAGKIESQWAKQNVEKARDIIFSEMKRKAGADKARYDYYTKKRPEGRMRIPGPFGMLT